MVWYNKTGEIILIQIIINEKRALCFPEVTCFICINCIRTVNINAVNVRTLTKEYCRVQYYCNIQ